MNAIIGQPVSRVDGPAKVTGQAVYAAEFKLPNMAYAALVDSSIPRGRIVAIDTTEADHAPGVVAVITHENAERLAYRALKQRPPVDPASGEQLRVFQGPVVLFAGQPVAVVVAETQEQADGAARLVRIGYAVEEPTTVLQLSDGKPPSPAWAKAGRPADTGRGDADAAFGLAAVKIEIRCSHAREQHNAMEPHATIAEWDGDRLTLYDKSQWVGNVRMEIAHVFDMPEANIRVINPYVGGAFGSALRTWPHVTIAAMAARRVRRPVRVELTRRECFTSIGFRPMTVQRVALGARRDGRLTSVIHEATAQTSAYEEYAEATLEPARTAYSCPNVRTRYRLVEMNTNTPCPMRAPGVATGTLGLEMAMDELAEALDMDPLELRLRNYAEHDEAAGLPWSSKELRACYELGARRFGWQRRAARPGEMRDGRLLVGYGMATAIYHAERSACSAQATMYANGTAVVRVAASDMGPGTYTSMTQVAAETLGLPIEAVDLEIGDTEMPKAPVHGGSITMASVGNAVKAACDALREKLDDLGDAGSFAELLHRLGLERIEAEAESKPGEESKKFASAAFGAVFAEVRVDPTVGAVRVPRVVGAYDVGRVINPKLARSQCIGGMVGGIGMALHEIAEWDARLGRVMNANLAEYLVPVNADVVDLDVQFVAGNDMNFNQLGAKGLAEIALCGVAPAIANAVWHATGRRVRDLPIRAESLVGAG
ncbi:MAG TPA: xanthine dehydrogenase family protein molybdopterin-binding subunit [Acetobacteraceae bacterium]|nr:xanthine dehydrogenase family protein molybdopterin-binding subunit [Acetobacteraceae bacterium]